MKLILDKNFIQETEKFDKEHEKAVKFKGWTADGEEIELVDMEKDKIAPIVRFLAEGKKKKLGWLLIIGAGLLLFLFFGLMVWALYPKEKPVIAPQIVKQVPLVPENTKDLEVIKTEKITEDEVETSWTLEMANEVDMFEDMKNEAEIQALKLSYEAERLKVQLEEYKKDNEKLTNMVNNLEQENIILSTRKSEGATDDFIYYLGDSVYKSCKQPTTEVAIEKCKTLYFNFLEYGKNR